MTCVCGKGPSTEACCGRFFRGEHRAATAEELMRARYSAFVLGEVDFIVESHHARTRHEVDRSSIETWSRKSEWLGLEIASTEGGTENDERGVVEFVARYNVGGLTQTHHERAEFEKDRGRWFFVDGKPVSTEPVRRAGPRVGRNDPCPCGSGKKYKKCCGKAA